MKVLVLSCVADCCCHKGGIRNINLHCELYKLDTL